MNMVISPVNTKERAGLDMKVGDTVRVHQRVEEKGKTRTQVFEGLVIARKHGSEAGATFTVRKTASGVGMEKIFPLYSPNIEKIEVKNRSKTRRAKLYYIRDKAAKEVSKKMKRLRHEGGVVADETAVTEEAASEEVAENPEAAPETPDTQVTEETPADVAEGDSGESKEE